MNGQLKVNYAHVSIAETPNGDEVVIHIDAKWLAKTKISLLCSSHPSGVNGSLNIELDLYNLLRFKRPVLKQKKLKTTKTSRSKVSKKKSKKKKTDSLGKIK
tara:strand:+ start:329 stop:634 length:306 start_codon:yes stop_codon:yes gene_type:complete